MRFMILALAFISQMAFAQDLQDVIYKKDGSILRGSLIEQDFENGRYKIQLQGGSIFAVSKDDINKISKEAPLNAVSDSGAVNINIENNPTITQTPTQTLQQNPIVQAYGYTGSHNEEKRHSIRVGSMSKNITDSNDDGFSLSGINIAYQYNFDENIAFYAEYNKADFDTVIIDGEHYESNYFSYNYNDEFYNIYDDVSLKSIEASAMLSTNNYQGWQFYAGLGIFNEQFENQSSSYDISGTVVTLGMGYSWQAIQLQLRVSGHSSSDYGDDVSSSNTALQLGYNY